MPEKGSTVKFNNFHKPLSVPFVIYSDFEAITEKVQFCKPKDDKSYTEAYQKHTDCGYGYKLFAAMIISIPNQYKYTEDLMLYTNLWQKCLKRLNIVRMLSSTNSTSH